MLKMELSITRGLKWFILTFSFCMFCYQAQIAIKKLIDPPVVDLTDMHNIEDTKLPMITICARNQWNITRLRDFGYLDVTEFLSGNDLDNKVFAWGVQHNISFDKLLEEILNTDTNNTYELKEAEYEPVDHKFEYRFYPKFGWCVDVKNYTLPKTRDLKLDIEINQFIDIFKDTYRLNYKADLFLTDSRLRTKNSVYLQSHWGSSIIIENGWDYEFVIKVEQLSNFNPKKPKDCRDYADQEYEKDVQEKLYELYQPVFNCVPPWVSKQDQCSGIIIAEEDFLPNEVYNTFQSISNMVDYPAIKRCTKPCTITRSNVLLVGKKLNENNVSSTLRLQFDNLVVHRTKMLAYGFSDFLIDLGSSLGLWFGLSVFGITDLGIAALQLVKRMRLMPRKRKKLSIQSKNITIILSKLYNYPVKTDFCYNSAIPIFRLSYVKIFP